ncbi:MAG: thioredoxin domain-containing protein [Propionibacteriaceae bacterium]|nr:thioredoxin domain-containing protein [Propionibacteriaceae bacterium]
MSSKKPQNNPSASGNRREQLQRQREQQAKERKVRNIITFSILGVALLAIVGVIVAVVVSSRNTPVAEGGGAVTGNYSVLAGQPDAPVKVAIYQDFMCPYCGMFERANRDDLEALVDNGTAQIEFHVVNWQDRQSQGTNYSSRSGNAFVAVAKAQPDKVMAFNAALFDQQPDEGTPGLSDAEIASLARGVGVSNDVIATFARMANQSFIDNASSVAANSGITGTPTILIDGNPIDKSLNILEAGPLKAAIEQAAAGK